jgi:hypothetical protein
MTYVSTAGWFGIDPQVNGDKEGSQGWEAKATPPIRVHKVAAMESEINPGVQLELENTIRTQSLTRHRLEQDRRQTQVEVVGGLPNRKSKNRERVRARLD